MKRRDNQFYQLAESSPDAIFVGAFERFTYVNPAAMRLFGATSADQLLGQPILDRIDPDDRAVVAARMKRPSEHGESTSMLEVTFLSLDGSPVAVEISAVPFRHDGEDGGLVFVRDITQRKQADGVLRRERLFLRQIIDANPNLIFVKDQSGRFLLANSALAQAYGTTVERIEGRTDADFNPNAEEVAAFQRDDRAVMESRQSKLISEEPVTFADGSRHWYSTSKTPVLDGDGACRKILGVATEITDLKRVEDGLRRSGQLVQSIIDNSTAVIFVKDLEGRYLQINRRYAELFHVTNEQMLGRCDRDFFPAAVADAVRNADLQVLVAGTALTFEESVPQNDGLHTYISLKFPLQDDAGQTYAICGIATDITERKRAEMEIRALNQNLEQRVNERTKELQEREREFRTLADNVPDNIVRYDCAGRVIYMNKSVELTLGRSAAELLGTTPGEHAPDGRYNALEQAVRRVAASGNAEDFEQIVPGPGGESRYHSIRIVAEPGADGRPASVLAVGRDLTAQKLAEEELRLAASVFHNSAEGVLVTDSASTILAVNPAFTEITGYTEGEALGRKPNLLRSDRHGPEFYRELWDTLTRAGRWQGEIWNRRKDGEAYLEWITIDRIDDDAGTPVRYVSVFHDITELRRKDERIQHLAFHDALTGLPNRALMEDRLEHALARARREGSRLSVIFIDLDRFKAINDGLGHDVGDLLLQEVASRIKRRLRAADTVARLGGDEFVVLMEDMNEAGDCACLAQELLANISRPIDLRGHVVEIGASMGMAFFPEDGADSHALMKCADLAMYVAKSAGRNTYRFFQQDMLEHASQRLTMEMELRRGIANGDLELHYQPRVALATGELLGVEALVRWRHPQRGLLPPDDFIPLAEDSGLILELGAWVLDEACRQAAVWRTQGREIQVAVNVSARQLEAGDLVEHLTTLTVHHGIAPVDLEIELTESAVMTNPQNVAGLFARLRRLGVSIAVDDFGTGYSSLAYLRRLPIDVLKIDRSFIMDMDHNEEDAQIVKTILALGQTLKLTVVAEGIETARQADLLRSFGCDLAQGYYYARPLPVRELEAWLDRRRSLPIVHDQGRMIADS